METEESASEVFRGPNADPQASDLGVADLARSMAHALDPARFAAERLGILLDDWQARVVRSPARQICLVCSRQSGKSTVAALPPCTKSFTRRAPW